MKKFNINDNINFGQNSGKNISWLLNNKGNYLDWCFKNLDSFTITNDNNVYKSECSNDSEKLELKSENQKLTISKEIDTNIINIYEKNTQRLENILWKYQENEAVIHLKSINKYYNRKLEEISGNNFIGFNINPILSDDNGGEIINIRLSYDNRIIEGNINDIFFSKEYIIKTENGGYDHSFNTAYYDTGLILYNSDNMVNVFRYGTLDMKGWGNSLWHYSYRHHGSNDEPRYGYGDRVSFCFEEELKRFSERRGSWFNINDEKKFINGRYLL